MAVDGGFVYAARPTRLDRIEIATGRVERVAGAEYAACPADPERRFMLTVLDLGYPGFAVRDGVVYLTEPDCGLWAWDVDAHRGRMLITYVQGDRGEPYAEWGSIRGRLWARPWPITFAAEPDGLVVCVVPERFENHPSEDPRVPRDVVEGVELWSVALDGTPRERLAQVAEPVSSEYLYGTGIVSDAAAVHFAAGHAVYRYDRRSRYAVVATGLASSFIGGLFADEHGVYYADLGGIYAMENTSLPFRRTVLPPGGPLDPVVTLLAVGGGRIYYLDGFSLRRVPTEGGEPEELVAWERDARGAWPAGAAVAGEHVFFTAFESVAPHAVTDEETGVTIDDVSKDFWLARIAR